ARAGYKRVLRKGVVRDYPLSLKSVSGSVIDVEYNATVYRNDAGEIQGVFAAARDITERKAAEERMRKLNRVYAVLSGINQAIVRIRQPQALFEEACRVIVEVGDFRAAWVGLVDSDGKHVRAVAQAGAIGSYLDELNIVLGDEERGKGPTGVSISERRHVISQDIEHDPSMAPWRESALRQGYRSSASFPLVVKDEAVGAFSVYGDEPGFFDKEQVHLLDALAMDMSFAMEFAEGEARRRQAEEVIREDEVELQEAQRIGHFGNFDWDARTDTIVWSDEYYRIYGFDPKQPPPGYQEHLKVYSPESAARLDAAVNRSMQTGEPYELDLEQVRPDGTRSWVIARGEVKRDADGKIIGLRGTAQDITERKQGEQKRLRAEKFFRDTFEHADVGIAHVGVNGNWLRVNPRLCDMLGYTREELLATTFAAITHPDDVDENVAAFRSMLAGEKSGYDADKRYLRKDGSIVWVHLNIVLIRKEDGTPDYNLDVITDITERKRAEEVIRADQADLFASREQLRATVERAAVGIARLSLDGRWLDANECLCKMLGYSHDELVGMAFSEITMPETVDRDLEGLGKLVRGEIEQYNCEKRYRTKDGHIVWGDVFSVVARDEEGKPAYLVAVTQDITGRKEAEKLAVRQAEHIERTLTSVVDIASSIVELRDPYTAGHQRRVSELAVRMAEGLGMSGHEIDDIRVAGLLHDMGKAGIPTEILSKPGELSPIEFTLIQGHAEAGYRLAVSANMAEPIADMIYQHHERCDGSGYPRGLTGDQTLLGAKVLAVADVVEAMMSHRPYRPALGIEQALAEIERGAGRLYDAEVSKVCVALVRGGHFEFSA
ncbi:MAG TPA: PAS domain S-box protein, partial [Coriobacteriia bacterium]